MAAMLLLHTARHPSPPIGLPLAVENEPVKASQSRSWPAVAGQSQSKPVKPSQTQPNPVKAGQNWSTPYVTLPRPLDLANAQVNHLGPYTLTRMLESKLVNSKARVVNVASVTHRITRIKDVRAFFTEWKGGFYQHNKLANVYFAFELQRRWWGGVGCRVCG